MSRTTEPAFTKKQIDSAGRSVRNGVALPDHHRIIENFRVSHIHVLNGFQASLRNRARDNDVTVAQRLKRRVTIYDKLARHRTFSLSEMQDIAGCRLIFKNMDDLSTFRNSYHKARFAHKLLTGDNRYDYVDRPKSDGYRGIHDVYQYHAMGGKGSSWDGLRIELQYRTIYQHAWATAVEVAGLLTGNEHKFGRAAPDFEEFFCMSSELIARTFEARNSCRPHMSMVDLANGISEIDKRIGIFNLFHQYNSVALSIRTISNNVILFFNKRPTANQNRTEFRNFNSFSDAVRELEKIEEANLIDGEPYDVVLVRTIGAPSSGSIQSAFRNYFADTKDFVSYLEQALSIAKKS